MGESLGDVVVNTITAWQSQLLQLDRNNRLLYFKPGATSVEISAGDADAFVVKLAAARRGLRFAYAQRRSVEPANGNSTAAAGGGGGEREVHVDPGEIITPGDPLELQKRLLSLRRKDREVTEEQGVNVLFLAIGFLHFLDKDDKPGKAPLVLVPCDLDVASPRDPYYLRREDEDPVVNATLVHVLTTLGVELPEFSDDMPLADYLARVERVIQRKQGWAVERSVCS